MANEFTGAGLTATTSQWRGVWELMIRMLKAGWRIRASSDGLTKVVSNVLSAHATLFPLASTGRSGVGASVAEVATHPYGRLLRVTGLAGLVAPTVASGNTEGNYLTLSGSATGANNSTFQVHERISATSAWLLDESSTAAVDAGGTIAWTEYSVMAGTFPSATDARQPWACLAGPTTEQLSFTTAPAGVFTRGELVTQTGSGATGECVGYVWSASDSLGWMIVQPRTGLFDATGVLTGASSGATVTPTARYLFRRQVVFWKGSTADAITGSSWYQCIRDDTEAAELFSTLASNAACTATVPPAGSPTVGNRASAAANWYVMRCQSNASASGGAIVQTQFVSPASNGPNGRIHIGVANAIPRTGRSADGSWWYFHGNTLQAGGGGNGMAWLAIDDGPPGEPEQWIHFAQNDAGGTQISRFSSSSAAVTITDINSTAANSRWYKIYNRAVGSFSALATGFLFPGHTARSAGSTNSAMGFNYGSTPRVSSHPSNLAPTFRDYLGVHGGMWGRVRHAYTTPLGNAFDVNADRSAMCWLSASTTAGTPAFVVGPFDGTSDPVQA